MATKTINLHKYQDEIIFGTEARFKAIIAGLQSGKTIAGAIWARLQFDKYPSDTGLISAPTHKILEQSTLPKFFEINPDLKKYYHKSDATIEVPNRGTIFIRSTENPNVIEGMTLRWIWADEAGQMKLDAWINFQGRLSILKGNLLCTTTPYCYSEDTEIYTEKGWMKFGDLRDEKVLAVDNLGNGKFEIPREIVWQNYNGKMYEFKGHAVNLLVTPNHRILYKNSNKFIIKTAEHFYGLKKRCLSIPKAVMSNGKVKEFKICGKKIDIKIWAAFMGWFLSEGSVMGSKGGKVGMNGIYKIVICQSDKSPKKKLIKKDLDKLPFKFSEHKDTFHTTNKVLWKYLSQFGNSHNKFVPREFNDWPLEAKKIFLNRLILGDGTYRNERHGEFVYYSSSLKMVETLKDFLMLMGIPTYLSKHLNTGGCINGRKLKAGVIYHLTERRRKRAMVDEQKIVDYNGKIGCVAVSTGLVLVRRNGEECISGNTMNWLFSDFYQQWKDGNTSYQVVQFKSCDNPYFPKEEYERVKATMDGRTFRRRYDGLFEKMEGLVYEDFIPSIHIVEPQNIQFKEVIAGVDFGFTNQAAIAIIGVTPDNVYYIIDEYYQSGKITSEIIERLKYFQKRYKIRFFYPDPADPAKIEEMKRHGIFSRDVKKGKDSVIKGIDDVRTLIRENRFFVYKTCRYAIDEFANYHYDQKYIEGSNEKEEPIKEDDHMMDAIRYPIFTFQPSKVYQKRPISYISNNLITGY